VGLNQQRLTVVGEVVLRQARVAVKDRDKLAIKTGKISSNSSAELEEEHIAIDIACMLDDSTCSPLGQIATAVADTLIEAALSPPPD
jgi:hypothetical protein